ncbi:MAG: ABC transporter substrate-binding protein [Candidatus Sumerlaeaceae bacterium]|nr:ABC transporter substrate-binding protein [Candidatus Sumerlaeaceae bacterium]
MNYLRTLVSLAVIPLACFLVACSQQPSSQPTQESEVRKASGPGSSETASSFQKPIVLAVAGPFTGDSSEFGVQIKMAVELATEQLNAKGGIAGRPIQLMLEDDAGNPAEAQNVATKIASNPEVLAVIGHFNSSCSLAAKSAYTEAKMVMFSPASTNVNVTKNSDYVFRNIFTDDFQGQSLARYAAEILSVKKVAILFDNDDYGRGLKESFKKKAISLGITVLNETAYGKDTNDFRSQLTTINGYQPELILIAGLYKHAAVIAKQARELGIKTPFIGGDGVFSEQYVTLAGPAANGTYVSCPFLFELGGERAKQFAEQFRAKYSREPDAWAALSYDAFQLIVKAIETNGATREGIHRYLKGINSPAAAYDGLTGKTFFDEEGDCRKPVQMAVVKDGRFTAAEKQLGIEESSPQLGDSQTTK